jgi:hypothetical protein
VPRLLQVTVCPEPSNPPFKSIQWTAAARHGSEQSIPTQQPETSAEKNRGTRGKRRRLRGRSRAELCRRCATPPAQGERSTLLPPAPSARPGGILLPARFDGIFLRGGLLRSGPATPSALRRPPGADDSPLRQILQVIMSNQLNS